jgi:YVTN family beta-propeller protein
MRLSRGSYGLFALLASAAACSSHLGSSGGEQTGAIASKFSIGSQTAQEKAFTAFETGQVRPLALSIDGRYLYATNTPDNRLEIFRVHEHRVVPVASVPVGLEPLAVAARDNGEVWVVNHLSDSVSIVDARVPELAHVTRTLLVGDEPRDIVFAGPNHARAFVTTAHRGQNTGKDPQLTTSGVGRADVWVFDANAPGTTLTGTPLSVITLFADTPRGLAVSRDRLRGGLRVRKSNDSALRAHRDAQRAHGAALHERGRDPASAHGAHRQIPPRP